jgi:hypothetical protein
VDLLNSVRDFAVLLLLAGLVYFALRIRRATARAGVKAREVDFCPSIGFTRLDGCQSVALLLENNSDERVWTEEIELALTDLVANDQASEASCHGIQKVHQNVRGHDMLPISLVEVIYETAGRPQRKYSCVLSSVVRYRVGEKWYEETMKTYRLRMIGLTVAGIRREKKNVPPLKPQEKIQALHAMSASPK